MKTLIHQLVLDGIMYQFRIVFHVHFFKNARAVGADSFYTQGEFVGDFRDGFAGCQHAQNLIFPVRQCLVGHFFKVGTQLKGQLLGNRGAYIFAASTNFSDRVD
jgi:hypothetical protein